MREFLKQSQIRTAPESTLRKMYSEFRSIANKRIQRLTAAGYGKSVSMFPTIQQIKDTDKIDMATALADVQKFLRSPRTTVSGQKRFMNDFRETMTEKGYGDLVETNEEIMQMIDYMDYLREQYSEKLFDSGDALDVLQQGQRLNIPADKLKENFDLFASNLDKMEKLRRSPGGKEFSQSRIDKLIKKWS